MDNLSEYLYIFPIFLSEKIKRFEFARKKQQQQNQKDEKSVVRLVIKIYTSKTVIKKIKSVTHKVLCNDCDAFFFLRISLRKKRLFVSEPAYMVSEL